MGKLLAFLFYLTVQLAAHGLLIIVLWLGLRWLLRRLGRPTKGLLTAVLVAEQLFFWLLAFHPIVWCPTEWQDQYTARQEELLEELVPPVLTDLSTPVFVKVRSCGRDALSLEIYSFVSTRKILRYAYGDRWGGGGEPIFSFAQGWYK